MMSGFEALLDLFRAPSSEALSFAVGIVLSPAKLVGLVLGVYKAISLSYTDNTWKEFIDSHDDMKQ